MQSLAKLRTILERLADPDHYLFAVRDFAPVFPELSYTALKALLARAVNAGLLERLCKGIYLYPRVDYPRGFELYHGAARLRADHFNYISLETALSDAAVISQVPINWITILSSGRTHQISCGHRGTIEFIHTKKSPGNVAPYLTWDERCRLWRASPELAMQDMRATGRSLDLVDRSVLHEFI